MEHSLNYIYIYDGKLPNYIKKSIQNTINIDSDASIIFCNNQKFLNYMDLKFQGHMF